MTIKEILEEKSLVVNSFFLKVISNLNLDLKEFLFLLYFINDSDKIFDVTKISTSVKLPESDVLRAFNALIKKKIILVDSKKNESGKITEYIKLDYLYNEIEDITKKEKKESKTENIFSAFEREFVRPISSMEYEKINDWLEKDFTEELILGALKQSIYNGVHNLRYIDKILYEWRSKGFKTMKEVNNHINKHQKDKNPQKELFDYNWLDEENN